MLKLLLLAFALSVCVLPSAAGENQKRTGPSESTSRSCTDLSGEPVPCPEGHNQVVLPSAKNGSAEVRHCVDLLGNAVPCPGESPVQSETPENAATPAPATTNSPMTAGSSTNTSGSPAASKNATNVVPVSSKKTSVVPAESATGSPCHDLLGQPVSCPVDPAAEAAATAGTAVSSATGTRAVYVEPTTKPQTSLERSLPKNIYLGQKEFWTYPARMRLDDAYWAVPFGIVTGGLMASDVSIKNALPQSPSTIKRFKSISNYGALGYGALVGGTYLLGRGTHNSYLSDTAWLAGEAGLNSFITTYGLKYAFGRERPTEGNGQGDFFSGGQSFPSEHAAAVWSVATVFAGRYPGTLTKLGMFGGAALVSASRVIAQQHFTSDAFVGSALGYYFGRQALKRYQQEHATDAMYGTFVKVPEQNVDQDTKRMASTYVPLDSWIYPAFERLNYLGITPIAFAGIQPWTRMACARMVEQALPLFEGPDAISNPATAIVLQLKEEFRDELALIEGAPNLGLRLDSVYGRMMGVNGNPLVDGYHFGQTVVNDLGRPYGEGMNWVSGISAHGQAGPFAFHFGGEYQYGSAAPVYGSNVADAIAVTDATLPVYAKPTSISQFRLRDTYVMANVNNLQISFGKQNPWLGPTRMGSFLYSDNAEQMWMLLITQQTPFRMPILSKILGPVQAQYFLGRFEGPNFQYTDPNLYQNSNDQPWLNGWKANFKPTPNLEFGLGVTGMFAGQNFPFNTHTFIRSLFSQANTQIPGAPGDPGDRRATFDFSYRIPGIRKYLTLYTDSFVEDETTPIVFPRRAAFNPGIYMPQVPGIHKLDFRLEGAYTNLPNLRYPSFFYYNGHYRSGYTLENNIIGNWIGRQGVGVQAWTTYWFNARNKIELTYRHQQVDKAFLEGGRLYDVGVNADFKVASSLYMSTGLKYESWRFPILGPTAQSNLVGTIQFSFEPKSRLQAKPTQ